MKRRFVAIAFALWSISVHAQAAILAVPDEGVWQASVGTWSTADFEGFLGPVNSQYAGVTFQGFNGGTPNAITQFPRTGLHSMFTGATMNAGGGGFAAVFDTPVQGVGFWAGDLQFPGSTVSLFDSDNSLLASFPMVGAEFLYVFNGFISDSADIARVEVAIEGQMGDAIWFDDFQFSQVATVPEPATLTLWSLGALGCIAGASRRRSAA